MLAQNYKASRIERFPVVSRSFPLPPIYHGLLKVYLRRLCHTPPFMNAAGETGSEM